MAGTKFGHFENVTLGDHIPSVAAKAVSRLIARGFAEGHFSQTEEINKKIEVQMFISKNSEQKDFISASYEV